MADRIELTLRPKADIPPLDAETAEQIGGIAHAETVDVAEGGAVFGFSPAGDPAGARGNVELAARFVLGAHWQTRYDVVSR
jgi:hypothetical protein